MLERDDKELEEVNQVVRGRVKMPRTMQRLQAWINESYPVNVLHVRHNPLDASPRENPRLDITLQTAHQYNEWQPSFRHIPAKEPELEPRIVSRFKEFAILENETYDTDGLFVVVDCHERACIRFAMSKFADKHNKALVKRFPAANIWRVESAGLCRIDVFYRTDDDAKRNLADGTSDAIRAYILEEAKKYDEFRYLTDENLPLTFETKEHVDREFAGNLFYYFR